MHTDVTPKTSANNNASKPIVRFNWLDWMKVIGICLIVYGHIFSFFSVYVYVFSVPLFFVISGFLSRQEADHGAFWRKLWHNLVIPFVLICTINYLFFSIQIIFFSDKPTFPENPLQFYFHLLAGKYLEMGAMWFVYTLIILKIILQFTRGVYLHFVLAIVFCVLAYVFNNYNILLTKLFPYDGLSSIPSIFVSFPFFIIGYYLKPWKERIAEYRVNKYTFCWIVLSLIVVYLCGYRHKYVLLFKCIYGESLLQCIVGGLAGTALVFFVSKLLDRLHWRIITDISLGTIIILGFHEHFINLLKSLDHQKSIVDSLLAVMIVLAFVPLIRLCERYFPIILGKYRVKKQNNAQS